MDDDLGGSEGGEIGGGAHWTKRLRISHNSHHYPPPLVSQLFFVGRNAEKRLPRFVLKRSKMNVFAEF